MIRLVLAALLSLFGVASAPAATLLPNGQQCFQSLTHGGPLAAGTVFMFVPNSTVAKQTWQDSGQTVLNQNPIPLDANGCAVIYGTGTYRQVVTDSHNTIVWDRLTTDTSVQSVQWAGTASNASTPNSAVLNDPGFNATDGSIISFIPTQQNTSAFSVSFSGTSYTNIPVVLDMISGPQPLTGGEIAPNNIVMMIYSQSENTFHLVNSAQAASLDILNSQVSQLVNALRQQPTVQTFSTGTGTYVPTVPPTPAGASAPPTILYDRIRMVAAGGGGAGTGAPGSVGGATSFNDWTTVGGHAGSAPSGANPGNGGAGGSGGSNGAIGTLIGRWPGGSGSGSGAVSGLTGGAVVFPGGAGGSSCFGGGGGGNGVAAGANTGGGGSGAYGAADMGGTAGGGAGECVEFIILNPTSFPWSVGAGGGSGGPNASSGASGYIVVEEYYH